MNKYNPPKAPKAEVFFTDAERLAGLIEIHRNLLDGGPSAVLKLTQTLAGAEAVLDIINSESQRKTEDPSYQRPAILHLELDEVQRRALRLARDFTKNTPESGLGSVALAS